MIDPKLLRGAAMPKEEGKKKTKRSAMGGIFIPAGLFIGMGIGWALDYMVAGMFIGLGVGFLGLAITMVTIKD